MTIVDTLVKKWSRTGLLKGLTRAKAHNMARLLEGQATEVLRKMTSRGSAIRQFQNGSCMIYGCSIDMCRELLVGSTYSRNYDTFSNMQVKR